jgi:Ni,Fe-hydrogenase III large subunit
VWILCFDNVYNGYIDTETVMVRERITMTVSIITGERIVLGSIFVVDYNIDPS